MFKRGEMILTKLWTTWNIFCVIPFSDLS